MTTTYLNEGAIGAKVFDIVAEVFFVDRSTLSRRTSYTLDLRTDLFPTSDLVDQCEAAFDIYIDEGNMQRTTQTTIGDTVTYIWQILNQGEK